MDRRHRFIIGLDQSAISSIDSKNENVDKETVFQIKVQDYVSFYGMCSKAMYSEIEDAAKDLIRRVVNINLKNDEHIETPWLAYVHYKPQQGSLEFKFAEKVIPYITFLKSEFTIYKLIEIAGLRSIYSVRIYEMLAQWRSVGSVEVKISDLRERFQIGPSEYTRFSNLKMRVINPAIEEVTQKTNFTIDDLMILKKGVYRKNPVLIFRFHEKNKTEVINKELRNISSKVDKKLKNKTVKDATFNLPIYNCDTYELPLQ